MKSRIKSKKAIKFGQELIISNFSSPNVDSYADSLKKQRPHISNEELNREVFEIVKRDSFYNVLMDEVAKAYEFELDSDEVQERVDLLMQSNQELTVDVARTMAVIPIYKQLIYEDLEREWEINISDEEAKRSLEHFYKETGHSIREYLMDKEKFEGIKRTMVEQLITNRLMNAFKPIYRFPNSSN